MNNTKNRIATYRKRLAILGLKQRSIYAHDDDWPQIQKLIDRLRKKREKDGKESRQQNPAD